MSEISRADVEHLATLARIALTADEVETMSGELGVIVDSIASIGQVAAGDVPATSHPLPLSNVLRPDEVGHVFSAEESLGNAPDAQDGRFKVPAILEGE